MSGNDEKRHTTSVCDSPGKPIKTFGEVFTDGSFLEVARDPADHDALQLMFFDGETARIAPRVEHRRRVYFARDVAPSIVRELYLPSEVQPIDSVLQLFVCLVQLIQRFSGLPDNSARLVARIVLATWVVGAFPSAPSVLLVGPDSRELTQLFHLLKGLCRRALLLTEVNAGALHSLPMEMDLTLLIDQPELSEPAQRILNATRTRDKKVPHRGNLWRPFSSKVIHLADYFIASIEAIRITVLPTGRALPVLDDGELNRIANEFQPRLLAYRFANYGKAHASQIDCCIGDYAIRDVINGLAACTPECPDLQAEVVGIAAQEAAEVRQARWTEPQVVLIESLLLECHTETDSTPYCGKIADAMSTISSARGVERIFKANQAGTLIRRMGFTLEPRDRLGVRLLLTEGVRRQVHKLARDFGVPSIDIRIPDCPHCAELDEDLAQSAGTSETETPESE
jgi:hypothetical protein